MADNARDRFYISLHSLTAQEHHDFQHSYLLTYAALMHHVNLEPANEFFERCFPSIETIRSIHRQGRRTVFAAIAWLETNDYIYHERRGAESSLYTVVLRRERFLQIKASEGREAAIKDNERYIERKQLEARAEKADEARRTRQQSESPHPVSKSEDPKCLPLHLRGSDSSDRCSEVQPGIQRGVQREKHILRCIQNKIEEIGVTRTKGEQDSGANPPEVQSLEERSEKTHPGAAMGEEAARQNIKDGLQALRGILKPHK